MAVTDAEIENLRFHLGYGNIAIGAYPSTPDGFRELFTQVIAPYLTGDTETTASTDAAVGTSTVTVASMTGIVVNARLMVDVGDLTEIVAVRAVAASSFTAVFANAHTANFPVAVMGGQARLRLLLHRADATWQAMQSSDVGDAAGIKRIEGDIEWFPGGGTLKERRKSYDAVVNELSRLTRVPRADVRSGGQLEAY